MNRKTHPSEEVVDELCREIVNAAQASEAEIHAAANAPFLYQRLRAQIAAEQKPIATIAPSRSSEWSFVAAFGAFQNHWRWAFAAAALALIIVVGWQARKPSAPQIAGHQRASSTAPEAAKPNTEITPASTNRSTERAVKSLPIASKIASIKATKAAPNKMRRAISDEATTEIATEFLPLTYSANRDDQRGQIVRLEMPRSVLTTMGVPTTNITGDRVKADVMLSDDGVALAIRFIQP